MNISSKMTDQTLSPLKQVEAIFSHELHRLSGRTRFIVFALIHSVLVVGTLLYFWIYPNVVRLSTFTQLTESVIYSLVIPITAMFFGGSIIAEEIDSSELVFVLHRPIRRAWVVLGKWSAATSIGIALAVFSLLSLLLMTFGVDFWSLPNGRLLLAGIVGIASYAAVFTWLALIFESSIAPAIVYFVVSEVICHNLPIIELVSIRYHLYNTAGLEIISQRSFLDRAVIGEALQIEWLASLGALFLITAGSLMVSTLIFTTKEFDF